MRFHCGFSFNWKTIKKWLIPILIGIFLLFSQKLSVYAITEQGYIESGDSVKSFFNIGNNAIGSNYSTFIDVNQQNQGSLSGYFYMYNSLNTSSDSSTFHFYIDHCKTGTSSTLSIYSSYYNYVDYSYSLGTSLYLAEGDYARATCYRSFIRLRLKYQQADPINEPNLFMIQNYNNNFATYNGNTYGILLRYNDLVYLSESDYTTMLNNAKNINNNNTIISQNQTIINQNETINNSINDINDSITDPSIATGSSASSYFGDNIWLKNYGISSLITIPINFIQSITSSTCTPITLNLPYVENKSITLPCISNLMQTNFQGLYDLYQLIIGGFIGLYCGLHIYRDIEDAINPFKDMPITQLFIG